MKCFASNLFSSKRFCLGYSYSWRRCSGEFHEWYTSRWRILFKSKMIKIRKNVFLVSVASLSYQSILGLYGEIADCDKLVTVSSAESSFHTPQWNSKYSKSRNAFMTVNLLQWLLQYSFSYMNAIITNHRDVSNGK